MRHKTIAIFAIIGIIAAFFAGQFLPTIGKPSVLPQILPSPVPAPISPIVVTNRLRVVSELTTAARRVKVENIRVSQDNENILIFGVPPTIVDYDAEGDVRAGFNLSFLSPNDIIVNGQEVTVRLPSPEILAYGITDSEFNLVDVPDFAGYNFGRLDTATLDEAQRIALLKIVQDACEEGILEDANRYAEQAIVGPIMLLGFQQVHIVTQPSSSCPN